MLNILLNSWATYLFVAWFVALIGANLWLIRQNRVQNSPKLRTLPHRKSA